MDYRFLTAAEAAQICRQKALELEVEHARLALDIRLAEASGIDNDNVTQAKGQLAILVVQMEALASWTHAALSPAGTNGAGG